MNLGLGADVHAASRLVQEEHATARRQPFSEHDLLLVAPRKPTGGQVETGGRQFEAGEDLLGPRPLGTEADPAKSRALRQGRKRQVLERRQTRDQALALAILG